LRQTTNAQVGIAWQALFRSHRNGERGARRGGREDPRGYGDACALLAERAGRQGHDDLQPAQDHAPETARWLSRAPCYTANRGGAADMRSCPPGAQGTPPQTPIN